MSGASSMIAQRGINRGAHQDYSNPDRPRYSHYRAQARGWRPGAPLHVVRERCVRPSVLYATT